MSEVIVTSQSNLRNEVRYGAGHTFITDEPVAAGGEDAGPDPYTLLLAALGSCISMTVTLYARRKQWPLEQVTVRLRQNRIHSKDCQECLQQTEGYVHRIERAISFTGALSEEQRARLQEIAHKCPVHKTLSAPIIVTEWKEAALKDVEEPGDEDTLKDSDAGNFFES
ncbi:MAG TPA: OsmC family protein [Pyrinomonadaceae bacterium]|nr:OsmC family protein [Pyrinomonadaceae bacterium]